MIGIFILFVNFSLDERLLGKYTFIIDRFNNSKDIANILDRNYFDILLSILFPYRYGEFNSVLSHLSDGFSFLFGKGFGFRYDILRESNISNILGLLKEDVGNNISNAHFTPIGIFLKFGFLGFISWTILLTKIIYKIFHRNEFYFVKVSLLAIIGYIFQSLFAFGFFINMFTPFLIGLCLAKVEKKKLIS